MTEIKPGIIDVHELKNLFDKNANICLIDVREQHEWLEASIPGAIHIPQGELIDKIESTVADKNQPVYLHCKGGMRSLTAAQNLIAMGYQQVYSVEGGISAWDSQGYPINQ